MKRFTDPARMDEEWYCELSLEMRAAFEFLWAKADAAGVWPVNHKLAEFHVGKKLNWVDFIQRCGGRIVPLDARRYFLRDFLTINYGTLSRECRPHNHVFVALERHKLDPSTMVLDTYQIGITKDKDKIVQEEDKKEGGMQGGKARGTVDELKAFCVELGLPASDGEWCFHKWEGAGWKNGGETIKCWKSTIRAWKTAGYLASQKTNERTNSNQRSNSTRNVGHNANLDYSKRMPKAETGSYPGLRETLDKVLQRVPPEEQSKPSEGAG